MKTIELTLYIGCPMRCSYCPQQPLLNNYLGNFKFDFAELTTCISKIPADVRIDLSGFSESLMYEHFCDLIKLLQSQSRQYALYTTFFGLTEEKIDTIIAYPPSVLSWHIPNVEMKTKVNQSYFDMLNKFIKLYGPIGDVSVLADIQESLTINVPFRNTPISRAGNNEHIVSPYITGKIRCSFLESPIFNQNALLPNGDVYLCCMDFGLKHKIGNLLTSEYSELMTLENQQHLVDMMRQEDSDIICRKCFRACAI